jgi:hypothetical protein
VIPRVIVMVFSLSSIPELPVVAHGPIGKVSSQPGGLLA